MTVKKIAPYHGEIQSCRYISLHYRAQYYFCIGSVIRTYVSVCLFLHCILCEVWIEVNNIVESVVISFVCSHVKWCVWWRALVTFCRRYRSLTSWLTSRHYCHHISASCSSSPPHRWDNCTGDTCTHTHTFNGPLPGTTRRGTVVERRSLAGELSLSCAWPAADGWPLLWVGHPL